MRYKKRLLAANKNELYSEHFKDRGVDRIDQYATPVLNHATPAQIKKLNIVHHAWTYGDKYYKLAHQHYNDSELWWIIAWYNGAPTEADLLPGDQLYIPVDASQALKLLGL